MGGGRWTATSFVDYSTKAGKMVTASGTIDMDGVSVQDAFKSCRLHDKLNPFKVMRECRDSDEHPNTLPVILALDVTGSMGPAAKEVASKLHVIMEGIFKKTKDVEFLIMGIGDLYCDNAPIQASQFESDIRIAEQLDLVFFEGGGGGNDYESYTAAWYFGLHNTDCDCWKRGRKGIIITMGDEECNPYIPVSELNAFLGCEEQTNVDTARLFSDASGKFDIHHIHVNHSLSSRERENRARQTFSDIIGEQRFHIAEIDCLDKLIVSIVTGDNMPSGVPKATTPSALGDGVISW